MSTMIGNVTVSFNRRANLWEARNGQVVAAFPAGQDGQQAALAAAVASVDPELHAALERLVRKRPYLASRAWKAAQLILNGHVRPGASPQGGQIAIVTSQAGPAQQYPVSQRDGLVCACDDYQFDDAPYLNPARRDQKLCKHVLAVLALAWLGRLPEVADGTG